MGGISAIWSMMSRMAVLDRRDSRQARHPQHSGLPSSRSVLQWEWRQCMLHRTECENEQVSKLPIPYPQTTVAHEQDYLSTWGIHRIAGELIAKLCSCAA